MSVNPEEKIKLSVCIPTRNRANFIGQALDSIISQADNTVEIVMVDGASEDDTPNIVNQYRNKFGNITYYRGETNPGVDRDMGRSVELARGEYCWLFSDDDMLKPGAIRRILKEIESGNELYLCNVTACDINMHPLRDRFWLSAKTSDRVFNLHEKADFIEYSNLANSIGAFFSYTSSVVLRRNEWLKSGYNNEFDGSAYAMAATLFSFFKRRCRLKYIRDALIFWRNDNESFQNEGGLVKRFLLDFNAYLRLSDVFLSHDKDIKASFLKVMTREHPWYTIINATSFIDNQYLWENFRSKMIAFGYSPKMASICYSIGRHRKLVSVGVDLKRKILKSHVMNRFLRAFIK